MRLSENFTLEEMMKSTVAKRLKIDNTPSKDIISNLQQLATNVLQPIREHFKLPVTITSGYRCSKLNKAVGGATTSQHTAGKAVDFTIKGISIEDIFQWCKKNLKEYDQLIQEKGQWVHISYNKGRNRRESLRYDGKKYIKV